MATGRSITFTGFTERDLSGDTRGAIDLGRGPSDSMDMEMQRPNWKDHSWLPYCWAILIFLCSRAVVALGLVFSQKYLTIYPEVWSAGPFWYHQLLQWDSEWYFKIATEGYRYNGDPTIQQNIVFYPLYPMLARGIAATSGLTPADALLLVANVAGLLAIVALFKLVREEFDDQLALASIALLSFFPASVILSAGYTEPLELLLIVLFFLVLKRKRYLSAALLAGLPVSELEREGGYARRGDADVQAGALAVVELGPLGDPFLAQAVGQDDAAVAAPLAGGGGDNGSIHVVSAP